ncbi:HTH CENPB-type domain-containing protein [Trichonephila clavata]|uniref:HTH CENPB-type domain-containing protein n=1 Tax=Trichonephila clavata TaxID=2740835 RepID=A0A8X6GS63_TRICU|nr:HTH CENPB-type domain-containing protein [Trichonephila clavata]
MACCNSEDNLVPPYCIFKGKRKNLSLRIVMPPVSNVEMNEKSAYLKLVVFIKFLMNHFIPRKEPGKVLLILDSHASHCSDVTVLDLAAENAVTLFCLPSLFTPYLQSLDCSFFKPLKTYW